MNVLDSDQFKSMQRKIFGSGQCDDVSVDFLSSFISSFANDSIGLDLSNINVDVPDEYFGIQSKGNSLTSTKLNSMLRTQE